jgi:hypothetical protein
MRLDWRNCIKEVDNGGGVGHLWGIGHWWGKPEETPHLEVLGIDEKAWYWNGSYVKVVDWIISVRDRDDWPAVVIEVIKFPGHCIAGVSWTICNQITWGRKLGLDSSRPSVFWWWNFRCNIFITPCIFYSQNLTRCSCFLRVCDAYIAYVRRDLNVVRPCHLCCSRKC